MIDVVVATADVAEKSATASVSVLEKVPEVPKPEMVNVQASISLLPIGPRTPSSGDCARQSVPLLVKRIVDEIVDDVRSPSPVPP